MAPPQAKPIPVSAAVVAPVAEPEEDEWEWEIALARARVAAEEVQAAVMPAPVRPSRRTRLDTVPPPPRFIETKTEPMPPPVIQPKPKMIPAKTLPIAVVAHAHEDITAEISYDDPTRENTQVRTPLARTPKATPAPMAASIPAPVARAIPRAKSPTTIIPIPKLPRVTTTAELQPVVGRTRFPKATPTAAPAAMLGISPPPPIRPAEDDKTSPGFLPPAARAVTLPRIPSIIKR